MKTMEFLFDMKRLRNRLLFIMGTFNIKLIKQKVRRKMILV